MRHYFSQFFWRRWAGVIGAVLAVGAGYLPPVVRLADFPHHLEVPVGQTLTVAWTKALPLTVTVAADAGISIPDMSAGEARVSQVDVYGRRAGRYSLKLALFGWLPWRRVPVEVTPPVRMVPGGESVGVVVKTRGLMVTGLRPVQGPARTTDPAQSAGIDPGDVILAVNHRPVVSDRALSTQVNEAGRRHQALILTVMGKRAQHDRVVWPAYSEAARRWQIGAMVQDGASGVGTLTFYDPATGRYAALGHSLTDGVTRVPAAVRWGRITGANIVGVLPGTPSSPGQKVGVLAGGRNVEGTVEANGRFGIRGRLAHPPIWGPRRALPVALPDQVHPGSAEIVTVVKGQVPARFRIQILEAYPQSSPHTKGILFRVDDPRLLAMAGGVVQGMSGSPIIQDGRLVGAVTHVVVNRPAMGFGCYAYWMLPRRQ